MMGSKHCFAQGSKIFGVIQGGKFFEKKGWRFLAGTINLSLKKWRFSSKKMELIGGFLACD